MRWRTAGKNWEGRSWTLAPCLVVLATQIDVMHPTPHPTDGTVASRIHDKNNPSSDHRPHPYSGPGIVRALDVGETTEDDAFKIAEAIRRSRDPRVKYVLHEARMFSSYPTNTHAPFVWRPFGGAPHPNHVHISTEADADHDVRSWQIKLGGTPVPPPTDGNWKAPHDDVIGVRDMKAVHRWQGNDVLTDADIDYVVGDPNNPAHAIARETDWRWKYAVTKLLNVIMPRPE